jgi:uncharacterized membrane protein YfcA
VSFFVGLSVIGVGVVVGLMSAMFGVGGGVIMVPYIVTFLDKTQHVAEGTSLAVIVPTAAAGVIAHHKRGYISYSAGGIMAAVGVIGSFLGAKLALSMDPESLQQIFGLFTIVVGFKFLLDGIRGRREGAEVEPDDADEPRPGPSG